MNSTSISYLLAIGLVCCCINSVESEVKNELATTPIRDKIIKLHSKEMPLLNGVMEKFPIAMVRTDFACKAALTVLKDFDKIPEDPQIIEQHIKTVMKPIKKFFEEIHQFSFLIKPLVEECLINEKDNIPGQPKKQCVILEFLNTQINIDTFFERTVRTKEVLQNTCREFLNFFGSIKASLSPSALVAYNKAWEELRSQKNSQTEKQSTPVAAA